MQTYGQHGSAVSGFRAQVASTCVDRYNNFAELAAIEKEGVDYRIEVVDVAGSRSAVIAPHGGGIEPGTSGIARAIAGDDIALYVFEGIKKPSGNAVLHITSHHFDEPKCLEVIALADMVVAIHGCAGRLPRICIGGLDEALKQVLAAELQKEHLPIQADGHEFPATDRMNICNRGAQKRGVQLEISPDLRRGPYDLNIAAAVRRAIKEHSGSLPPPCSPWSA